MRKTVWANSIRVVIFLFMGLALSTINAGCAEDRLPVPADKTQSGGSGMTENRNNPAGSIEASAVSGGGRPASDSLPYGWDPFAWMREFRREMERSFGNRYDPWGGRPCHQAEPFQWLQGIQDEMDRFFERSISRWGPDESSGLKRAWTPRVDIFEDENNVIVRFDLPGMEKEGIEATVTGNLLTLKGEKEEEKEIKREDYQRLERSYGAFQRSITLPPYADTDQAVSSYENGVLEIKFPKKSSPGKKRIII